MAVPKLTFNTGVAPSLSIAPANYNLPNIGIGSGQAPPPTPNIYIGNQQARYVQPAANWATPPTSHPTINTMPFQFGSGIHNPIVGFGAGLLNSTLNIPATLGEGYMGIRNRQFKQGFGELGTGVLNGLGLGIGGGVAKDAAKKTAESFLPKLVNEAGKNVAIGAGFGGAYGASNAAANNQDILRGAVRGAAAGGIGGIAAGTGGVLLGEGARQTVRVTKQANKLARGNELGAVGKNVSPSLPQPSEINPTPVGKIKVTAGKGTVPSEAEFNKMIPAEPGVKVSGAAMTESKAGTKALPKPPNIPTNENPIKVQLSNPTAGDYGSAISDMQRAQSSIAIAAQRAQNAAKGLSANDRSLFAYARENPKLISQAENPKQLQEAINRYGTLTDTAHAFDTAAGGSTAHVANYYRHVIDLSSPEAATKFDQLAQKRGFTTDPFSYHGLNNQPRVFKTIAEAEKAGFTVTNKDPLQEIQDYANKARGVVGNQALARGAQLADAARGPEAALTEKFKVGTGRYIDISPEAAAKLRGVEQLTHSTNPLIRGLRTVNVGLKSTILSLGQFHTINIGALRAAPTLIARGHPVAAAKGLYGMFRAAFGNQYADRVIGRALNDGTVDKAAIIGMPYGGTGYNVEGTFLKHGVGSRTVFGKQIPMMHDQVARSIISDLERAKVPLDSPQAREAGLAGANLMGELNRELQNVRPITRKAMTEGMLAGQFTPSKFLQMIRAVNPSSYTKGGVAGKYASANVLANVAATTALVGGVGYAFGQKSDNVKDLLLRALIDPAAPTNMKDAKGNTVKLRSPGTDTSDVAKLLGIKLVRNADGHLGVTWHGLDAKTASDFGRARLSPLLSAGVKVLTNENYAGKPLYDPNAPLGTKVAQAATTLGVGDLPIGLQGAAYTKAVKSHLPGSVQEVLNAGQPGTNPIVKSIGSSFGLTPSTDQTVGKGLATSQYFAGKDKFRKSLNTNDQAIFDTVNPVKKNPLTGQLVYDATIFNKSGNYNLLADNPNFTDKYQAYQKSQPNHDPLWDLPRNQLQSVLLLRGGRTYPAQTYTKAGASLFQAVGANQPWYQNFVNREQAFYSKLPAGVGSGSNIDYGPQQSPYVAQQLAANNTRDPQVQQYFNDRATYENSLRSKQGLMPIAPFGQVGVAGQLDNPGRIAITPKGSSYGTGAPKTRTTRRSSGSSRSIARSGRTRVARVRVARSSGIRALGSHSPRRVGLIRSAKTAKTVRVRAVRPRSTALSSGTIKVKSTKLNVA